MFIPVFIIYVDKSFKKHFPLTDSTPLHIAAGEGHLSVLEILLQKGGDLKARDNSGKSSETKVRVS